MDKNIAEKCAIGFGLIGGLASIISIPDKYETIRTICIFFAAIMIIVGILSIIISHYRASLQCPTSEIDLSARMLGISRIQQKGDCTHIDQHIENSKNIKIIATTAVTLLRNKEHSYVKALEKGAEIRILISESNSKLLKDIDLIEGRKIPCAQEIIQVEGFLKNIRATTSKGKLKIGYYDTLLRSTLIICDNWGWLTLTLPPTRCHNLPSFEINETKDGLLNKCDLYFEKIWDNTANKMIIENINGSVVFNKI